MAKRKTREELDAEMQAVPVEPGQEERAEPVVDEQVERAEPVVEEQVERAEPVVEEQVERAEPVVEEQEERAGPVVDEQVEPARTIPRAAEASQSVRLTGLLESLLLAAEEPVELKTLLGVIRDLQPDLTLEQLKDSIDRLRIELREQGRGIRIGEVGGGYQLRTSTEAAPYIKKMVARRPPRLTRATLETLAIVAYRQPATRGEVEEIRGVDSGAVLRHLLDKKLVKILGRKDDPGRPLLYGTTKEFLGFFSMKDLKSLPTLQDFAELTEEHRNSLGLGPKEAEGEAAEVRPTQEDFLEVEATDAYAPVGEDEVIVELAESLFDLKKKNRELKKILPQEKVEKEGEAQAGQAEGEPTPPDSQSVVEEPGGDRSGSPGFEETGSTSSEGGGG
jgi:segregation and condensation protein B